MYRFSSPAPRGVLAAVALGVLITTLAACAEDVASGGGGGATGIDAGASLEDYQAAFADVDPIVLNAQTPAPKGQPSGQKLEDYFDAVTEWSDGKITFEIIYSNGAATPTEADDALADGRLDLSMVLPNSEPSDYPVSATLNGVSFLGSQTPVLNNLEAHGWNIEVGMKTPEINEAFDEAGMKMLVPWFGGGKVGLFCSEDDHTRSGLSGGTVATGSIAQSTQVESLGMAPTSLPYSEIYEALERGVVDCSTSAFAVGVLGGFISAAPHVTVDEEAGWALSGGSLAMGKAAWESLPLIAQQLFHDRLDVFLTRNIEAAMATDAAALKEIQDNDGEVSGLDAEGRADLLAANEGILDDLASFDAVADGAAWAEQIITTSEKWTDLVADLGFEEPVPFNDFGTWYEPGSIDVQPLVDRLMEEAYADSRPE